MLEAKLTQLNDNEILMYLGYRDQELDPKLQDQIESCKEAVIKASQPRMVYMHVPVSAGRIAGTAFESQDLKDLLSECHEAVLLAVTLGSGLEQRLMRAEVMNMADALIMDACASTAVENVCDHFQEDLETDLKTQGLYITDRFSPGYGDLSIEVQNHLCEMLNTSRRIGLTVTGSHLLVPRKSVTAIIGISKKPQPKRKRGCEVCSMFRTCQYRKKGAPCNG